MTHLVIGLLLFLGVHSVGIFSPRGRDRIVARIGAAPWRAVYSVLAVAGFADHFRFPSTFRPLPDSQNECLGTYRERTTD